MKPLRDIMPVDVDAESAARIWEQVDGRRRRGARTRGRLALAAPFALGVIAALLVVIALGGRKPVAPPITEAKGLSPRGEAGWNEIATAAREERNVDLEDGSRVSLGGDTRLTPLENTSRSIVLLLASGRAVFDVQPGGPRRWSIEAGLATVEVVGTKFSVERTPTLVTVEVERGTVLVRGERVPDRVRRLAAGERLEVAFQSLEAIAPPPATSAAPETRRPALHDEPSWRDLAQKGEYEKAYKDLGPEGILVGAKTGDVDQLLALADVARLSGHPADAIAPLRKIVATHKEDSRAALAAFTLGRIHLESLADASAAARSFGDAISLGLPRALEEDAYLRWIESRARASERDGLEEACRAYARLFTSSPRRATAESWGCKL